MTSRIHVLSDAVANKIAAGEVIEGPFSVVKELVENALDAGADEISIEVKGGGGDLVRVADNGVGMSRDDAEAAFSRFATSKLSTERDLQAIGTLGFRGEALPSMASVSRLRLVTREKDSVEATEVALVGGTLRDVRPAGRACGTTVEVSSLFFNTPARRKFLKSDRVETRRIVDLLSEYAILYSTVRFDLAVDGKPVLSVLPTEELRERVAGVAGSGSARDMFPVSLAEGTYAVSGLVGKPSIARPRRALQVIAVNGRPVRSRMISAAIRSGYGELLPRDRHPAVVLLIETEGTLVDVNVHPTKRDVRFGDSGRVFGLVERAVRDALLEHESAPELSAAPPATYALGKDMRDQAATSAQLPFPATVREAVPPDEVTPAEHEAARQDAKFWQLHDKYVFVQTREGVLVVDQHAAHERVLYEKARNQLSGAAEAGPSQQLLFPVAVELSPSEWLSYQEVQPLLTQLGLTVRPLSGRTVLLEAVPAAFPKWPQDQILQDILSDVPSGDPPVRDLIEAIARTCACRASIKAGDPLKQEEMRALIDQLFAAELPYSCPHGRPTFMRMPLAELDKRFGRT